MERKVAEDSAKTIESLTRNLLECYEELDLIYRLSREVLPSLDIQPSMERVLAEAMEVFDADLGWLEPAGEGEGLFETASDRADPGIAELLREGVVRDLVAGGKSRVFYALRRETGLAREGVPDTFLCTVLKTDRGVYGALCVGRHDGEDVFTAGDLKLAGVLSSQAAIALENHLLHRRRMEEAQAMIRMQEEVRLALEIQRNLLPKTPPRLTGYDVAGRSVPAQGVGGDYFDFIPMDDRRMAVCLGDVSGKGMPAALLMANLQAGVRGQTLLKATPADCLRHSNTLLHQNTDAEKFATCFYGILDVTEHCLCYANAGHERPVYLSRAGGMKTLDTGGLLLGVIPGATFPEDRVTVDSGDVLVLYSDGITEAVDAEDREFGVDRLREVVQRHPDATADELLDRIMAAVDAHAGAGPPSDDRTLVVVRRL